MKIGKHTVQVSKAQAALILDVADRGRCSYGTILNSREDNARIRTIFSLCDKDILRHKPKAGGWDCYVHVLTPFGNAVALRLALDALEAEKVKHETQNETNARRFGW